MKALLFSLVILCCGSIRALSQLLEKDIYDILEKEQLKPSFTGDFRFWVLKPKLLNEAPLIIPGGCEYYKKFFKLLLTKPQPDKNHDAILSCQPLCDALADLRPFLKSIFSLDNFLFYYERTINDKNVWKPLFASFVQETYRQNYDSVYGNNLKLNVIFSAMLQQHRIYQQYFAERFDLMLESLNAYLKDAPPTKYDEILDFLSDKSGLFCRCSGNFFGGNIELDAVHPIRAYLDEGALFFSNGALEKLSPFFEPSVYAMLLAAKASSALSTEHLEASRMCYLKKTALMLRPAVDVGVNSRFLGPLLEIIDDLDSYSPPNFLQENIFHAMILDSLHNERFNLYFEDYSLNDWNRHWNLSIPKEEWMKMVNDIYQGANIYETQFFSKYHDVYQPGIHEKLRNFISVFFDLTNATFELTETKDLLLEYFALLIEAGELPCQFTWKRYLHLHDRKFVTADLVIKPSVTYDPSCSIVKPSAYITDLFIKILNYVDTHIKWNMVSTIVSNPNHSLFYFANLPVKYMLLLAGNIVITAMVVCYEVKKLRHLHVFGLPLAIKYFGFYVAQALARYEYMWVHAILSRILAFPVTVSDDGMTEYYDRPYAQCLANFLPRIFILSNFTVFLEMTEALFVWYKGDYILSRKRLRVYSCLTGVIMMVICPSFYYILSLYSCLFVLSLISLCGANKVI